MQKIGKEFFSPKASTMQRVKNYCESLGKHVISADDFEEKIQYD